MTRDLYLDYTDANHDLYRILTEQAILFDKLWQRNDSSLEIHYKIPKYEEEIDRRQKSAIYKKIIANRKLINTVENRIEKLAACARELGLTLGLESLCDEYKLLPEERYIVISLFFILLEPISWKSGTDLLTTFALTPAELISATRLLREDGTLRRNGIIKLIASKESVFGGEYSLAEWVIDRITGLKNPFEVCLNWREERDRGFRSLLTVRKPVIPLDRVILSPDKKEAICRVIGQGAGAQRIFREWGFENTIFNGKAVSMLFYGPPGTGKTMTAEGIAHSLGKELGIADYSSIESCWWGESEKNIRRIFQEARKSGCVLLFDEADALFGRRLDERQAAERSLNMMTNLLMQEMEQFDGVVILTSNRELALDEAFERRISLKIRFDLPTATERARIWESFFTEKAPLAPDVDFEALGRQFELSGGHIKNAVLNAVREAAYSNKPITLEMLAKAAGMELPLTRIRKIGFQSIN